MSQSTRYDESIHRKNNSLIHMRNDKLIHMRNDKSIHMINDKLIHESVHMRRENKWECIWQLHRTQTRIWSPYISLLLYHHLAVVSFVSVKGKEDD